MTDRVKRVKAMTPERLDAERVLWGCVDCGMKAGGRSGRCKPCRSRVYTAAYRKTPQGIAVRQRELQRSRDKTKQAREAKAAAAAAGISESPEDSSGRSLSVKPTEGQRPRFRRPIAGPPLQPGDRTCQKCFMVPATPSYDYCHNCSVARYKKKYRDSFRGRQQRAREYRAHKLRTQPPKADAAAVADQPPAGAAESAAGAEQIHENLG